MFLKLFKGVQSCCIRGFAKQIHTQMCLNSLFDQRRQVENEWEDDEHEQKRAFYEEERRKMQENKQPTCEMTGKAKRAGSVDCNCKRMCTANKSETYTIHYEGGVGIISKI